MDIQAALYARVSSEQQASAHTVASQVAALRERVVADGLVLPDDRAFIDEGYSGATLIRPALERLRDAAAAGGVDRLYVHSPDRLARKYAYQALLIDELRRAGVEVVFLNRALGQSPEDDLLLQVQGMVAEYERAKILERSRRGKRHGAHDGVVNVLSGAPYGYQYITKHEGGGRARYEILLEEARVVRQAFDWVGRERVSIGEVVRRFTQAAERTRTGKTVWDRSTVWAMLKNPAYKGLAAFGKTRATELRPRLRTQRGRPAQPRRAVSLVDVPADEWIGVPVPALVSEALFATVQEQLQENRQRARQGQRGARYLLQGLVCCALCGYAYYGKEISPSAAKHHERHYAYYRCVGSDAYRFGGHRLCHNAQVRTDLVDLAVWAEVRALLAHPARLREEYQRRLHDSGQEAQRADLMTTEAQVRKLRQGIGRLIDSYAEGLIEKGEFEPRVARLKERVVVLETEAKDLADKASSESDLRLIIGHLDDFATTLVANLDHLDWEAQRGIIRTVVKRVEIDQSQVNVVFRIGPGPLISNPDPTSLQHCGRGASVPLWCPAVRPVERPLLQIPRAQHAAHEVDEPAVLDFLLQQGDHEVMIDRVEEALEVDVYQPFDARPLVLDGVERRVAGPPAPESMGTVAEDRLIDSGEEAPNHVLDEFVVARRDAEGPRPPIRLGDVDAAGRLEAVGPGPKACDNRPHTLVGEPVHGGPIDASRGGPTVGMDGGVGLIPQ